MNRTALFIYIFLQNTFISIVSMRLKNLRINPCLDLIDAPSIFNNSRTKIISGIITVDFDIYVTENLDNKLRGVFHLEKCSGAETLDSCMKFKTLSISNFCSAMKADNQIWSSTIQSIHPKFACPIKKGHYKSRNCTIDINLFKVIPVTNAFWKVRSEVYGNQKNRVLISSLYEGLISA